MATILRTGLYIYPWDIAERGLHTVVDECSAIGLNTVRLALVYHAVAAFRPDAVTYPLFFRLRGARYFDPSVETQLGSIKLLRDPSSLSPQTLSTWVEMFGRAGIAIVPWIVATHDVAAEDMFHLCQVSPFGEVYPHVLCPAHEEVQNYIACIGQDLDNRGLFPALELEHAAYGAFRHYFFAQHAKFRAKLPRAVEQLLSLCFCSACTRLAGDAGIDVGRLQRSLVSALRTAFISGRSPRLNRVTRSDLSLLRSVRARVVELLLDRVRAAVRSPLHISPLFEPEVSGFYPEQALRPNERLVVASEERSVARLADVLRKLVERGVSLEQVNLILDICLPSNPTTELLSRKIAYGHEQGVWELSFYNYGLSSRRERERLALILESERRRNLSA